MIDELSTPAGDPMIWPRVRLNPLPVRPKVSVLITNYNYEEFLPRSIESVLSQSWRPVEVVVSDDGSDDNSCETVNSYTRRGHPVVLVQGKHRGMAGCLNAAMSAASGEIICLLDADDYFFPGKLQAVVSAFRQDADSGFCIHRIQRIEANGHKSGVFPLLQALPHGDCSQRTILNSGILMGLPPTSALSLRREVADQIFPIPECFTGYAEQMIHRIAPLITPISRLDGALSSWTLHHRNDANCSRLKVQRLERELRMMEMLWLEQLQFLSRRDTEQAKRLAPLEKNALYMKMTYILQRLKGDKNADLSHTVLCGFPEIRHSHIGLFWRYSNRLPNGIFRRSIELLETQGALKQILGQLVIRPT